MLVSYRQVAPDFDLGHLHWLRAETSTFLRGRQASRSGWGKSSLLPLVGLSSGQNLTNLSDIVFQKKFVQGVRGLQPTNEHECGDVHITVGNYGQLALEVANVRFEAVALSHLDGEKVVVIPLSLPVRCILYEERFRYLLEVIEKIRRLDV